MKPMFRSAAVAPLVALLAPFASSAASAEEEAVSFGSNLFVQSHEALQRVPEPADSASHAHYPFAPATPSAGYTGPAFLLGYEVRASAPSNLSIPRDKAVVENDVANGPGKNDAIAVSAHADWAPDHTYSVACAVLFPTKPFALQSLEYSALNWVGNSAYNEKLRHRWLIQVGDKYYVHAGFVGRTGRTTADGSTDVIRADRPSTLSDHWIAYDPEASLFAQLDGERVKLGPALQQVTGVGLYMDSLDFAGAGDRARQWQFKLLKFSASGVPSAAP
jgi:hypothetical protein